MCRRIFCRTNWFATVGDRLESKLPNELDIADDGRTDHAREQQMTETNLRATSGANYQTNGWRRSSEPATTRAREDGEEEHGTPYGESVGDDQSRKVYRRRGRLLPGHCCCNRVLFAQFADATNADRGTPASFLARNENPRIASEVPLFGMRQPLSAAADRTIPICHRGVVRRDS